MRVRGRTKPGTRVVTIDSWKRIGDGAVPEPQFLNSTIASNDKSLIGKYCQIRGKLVEILSNGHQFQLMVRNTGGLFGWQLRTDPKAKADFAESIGRRVRISGVAMGNDLQGGQLAAINLRAMNVKQFQSDMKDDVDQNFQRVKGVVIAKDLDNWLAVSDDVSLQWIYTEFADSIPLQSRVEVLCTLSTEFSPTPTKRCHFIEINGQAQTKPAKETNAADLAAANHAPSRVVLRGVVDDIIKSRNCFQARLLDSGVLFNVRMDESAETSPVAKMFRAGNLVQVTGVRRFFRPSHSGPAVFRLIVDDPSTVLLISEPNHFFSNKNAAFALAAIALIGLFLIWNSLVRSKVRDKTKEVQGIATRLQAACDMTCEGLIFVDNKNRLIQTSGNVVEWISDPIKETSTNQATDEPPQADSACQRIADRMEDPELFRTAWHKALLGDEAETVPQEFAMADDNRLLSMQTAPIKDGDGKTEGRIFMFSDVTHQRKMEQELAHSHKQTAVGRLAGGIAHDFNNLLMAMSANVDLARQNVESSNEVAHHLDVTEVAISRASELTRQLLDFSRSRPLSKEVAHANDCVGRVGELVKPLLGQNVELCLQMAADVALTKIDTAKIDHVLLNLCLNARDSIGAEEGHITVSTSNDTHPQLGDCVKIMVIDDGEGMNRETAASAFEPFFSTKDVGKGTGLGLAVAYGIIQQHDGVIECVSQLGEGSIFSIFLLQTDETAPVVADSSTIHHLRQPDNHHSHQADNFGLLRILMIDDEPMIRDAGVALLTALGHETMCASGGHEAINLLKDDSCFDAVLLDLTMPGMSGRETLKQIKLQHPHLPVIICSGYSVDLQSLGDDPMLAPQAVLPKPFSIDAIRHVLNPVQA